MSQPIHPARGVVSPCRGFARGLRLLLFVPWEASGPRVMLRLGWSVTGEGLVLPRCLLECEGEGAECWGECSFLLGELGLGGSGVPPLLDVAPEGWGKHLLAVTEGVLSSPGWGHQAWALLVAPGSLGVPLPSALRRLLLLMGW